MIKSLILLLCAVTVTTGFQIGAPPSVSSHCRRRHHSTAPLSSSHRRRPSPTTLCLDLSDNTSDSPPEYLTPTQVKTLRKEASQQKARKQLATFVFSDETENANNNNNMATIINLLEDSELLEIRGISREQKRHVRRDSERLALEIEMELERPVFLLDTKGHAAIYYSPAGDLQLRTGYREGQWSKKPRPKRDARGQIIKGEYE